MTGRIESAVLNHFSDIGNQFIWVGLCNSLIIGIATAIRVGHSPSLVGMITATVIACIAFYAGTLLGEAIPGSLRMTYEGKMMGGMIAVSIIYLGMILTHVYKCMFSHSDARLMVAAFIASAGFLVNLLGSKTIIQNRKFLHYKD